MFERSKIGVIYLSHDRFDFYSPLVPNIISYYFPKDLMSDLEVKNKAALDIQIQGFIQKNKLSHLNLIFILSEHACFMKDVPKGPELNYDAEMSKFLEQVPFEHTSTKLFLMEKNARFVVTNRDLYEDIKSAFEKQGMGTLMIIPAFVIANPLHFVHGLDRETAHDIVLKMESYRVRNMMVTTMIEERVEKKEVKKEPNENKQTYMLLGILGILLIVLVVMVLVIRPFG